MVLTTFGVTSTTMIAERVAVVKNPNTTALTAAIDTAAGEVGQWIKNQGMTPSGITEADYPEDYQFLHDLLSDLALPHYFANTTGIVPQSAELAVARGKANFERLMAQPSLLQSYAVADGGNAVVSHVVGYDSAQVNAYCATRDNPVTSPLQCSMT